MLQTTYPQSLKLPLELLLAVKKWWLLVRTSIGLVAKQSLFYDSPTCIKNPHMMISLFYMKWTCQMQTHHQKHPYLSGTMADFISFFSRSKMISRSHFHHKAQLERLRGDLARAPRGAFGELFLTKQAVFCCMKNVWTCMGNVKMSWWINDIKYIYIPWYTNFQYSHRVRKVGDSLLCQHVKISRARVYSVQDTVFGPAESCIFPTHCWVNYNDLITTSP